MFNLFQDLNLMLKKCLHFFFLQLCILIIMFFGFSVLFLVVFFFSFFLGLINMFAFVCLCLCAFVALL